MNSNINYKIKKNVIVRLICNVLAFCMLVLAYLVSIRRRLLFMMSRQARLSMLTRFWKSSAPSDGTGDFPLACHIWRGKKLKMIRRAHPPRPRATGVESERMFGKNTVENSRAPAKCTNPILESALFLCNTPYCNLVYSVILYLCQGGERGNPKLLSGLRKV